MITFAALRVSYPDAEMIGNGIFKFQNIIPAYSETMYLKSGLLGSYDVILPCRDNEDDRFAEAFFNFIGSSHGTPQQSVPPFLISIPFSNRYHFDSVFLVGPDWHGYGKGTLDSSRDKLLLAIPCHRCEFSGDETRDEFRHIWIHYLNPRWDRDLCPKIKVAIQHPKTQFALTPSPYAMSSYRALLVEVDHIEGVPLGYLEVINFQNRHCTLWSGAIDSFTFFSDEGEPAGAKNKIIDLLTRFLIIGSG